MYVCICNAVTDRQIRAAVEGGASSLADLAVSLGVAAGCGCCRDMAQQVMHEARCSGHCAGCTQRTAAAA